MRVLERRDLSAPSFGVRIPPNFSKILRRWASELPLSAQTSEVLYTVRVGVHPGRQVIQIQVL